MKNVVFFLGVLVVASCATTNMKTYVDPEHKGKKYSKILVDSPNANFEFKDMLISGICQKIQKQSVTCVRKDDLFPPTREYSDQQLFEVISENQIDAWLIVGIGSGSSNSQYIGSNTFGSAKIYGNTAYGSSNSMATYSYSRQQGYSIVMYDMNTKHKAFIMDASTSASGLANVTNSVFASSLAGKIVKEMSASGFLK